MRSADWGSMIGKTVSHYRITKQLGAGGMGIVYRAEDTKLEREVALKFLPVDMTRDTAATERFVREAKAAARLSHPNICTIHAIDDVDGQVFIVMECIDGESLDAKIATGTLRPRESLDIAIQIAEGLAAAHDKGVVHRDIKPANIIMTQQGCAKILDFGLAQVKGATQLTKVGARLGTVAYMSPEQARGRDVDHRTDIWSLGVVLYEMLTGKTPFAGARDQAVIYSILNAEPEDVGSSATGDRRGIARILARALAKSPDARYESTASIAADLKAILQGVGSDPTTELRVQPSPLPSIAVLPFANMSPDPENVYFGDGLAEELANALARLPGLRVASRTSAFQFRGKDTGARETSSA